MSIAYNVRFLPWFTMLIVKDCLLAALCGHEEEGVRLMGQRVVMCDIHGAGNAATVQR
jgi:hypothetical protein